MRAPMRTEPVTLPTRPTIIEKQTAIALKMKKIFTVLLKFPQKFIYLILVGNRSIVDALITTMLEPAMLSNVMNIGVIIGHLT